MRIKVSFYSDPKYLQIPLVVRGCVFEDAFLETITYAQYRTTDICVIKETPAVI